MCQSLGATGGQALGATLDALNLFRLQGDHIICGDSPIRVHLTRFIANSSSLIHHRRPCVTHAAQCSSFVFDSSHSSDASCPDRSDFCFMYLPNQFELPLF